MKKMGRGGRSRQGGRLVHGEGVQIERADMLMYKCIRRERGSVDREGRHFNV